MAENGNISGVEAIRQLIEAQKQWTNYRPGQATNSFEQGPMARAISELSHSGGHNTIAGGYGFHIVRQEQGETEGTGYYYLNSIEGIEIGQNYIVRLSSVSTSLSGAIINIDSEAKKVIVNGYDPKLTISGGSNTNYLCILGHPELGDVNIGYNSFAFGEDNIASERGAVSFGRKNKSVGQYAFTEGYLNIANYGSHAEGHQNEASGITSHAEGREGKASGYASHSEGARNEAKGSCSHAEGVDNIASGPNSHASGSFTRAIGGNSYTEGSQTSATGANAHIEGASTNKYDEEVNGQTDLAGLKAAWNAAKFARAHGKQSHVEGSDGIAFGNSSHVEGVRNMAEKDGAHAEGIETIAAGAFSHVEGRGTKAQGDYAHAEGSSYQETNTIVGEGLIAGGLASHAEGMGSQALGRAGHAEGFSTKTYATRLVNGVTKNVTGAHAEGCSTEARATASHAEGYKSIADADYSHAGGLNTHTITEAQTAIGKYSADDTVAMLVVGAGASDTQRANCFTTGKDASGSNYITIGNIKLTETQLSKIVNLIDSIE